MKSSISFDPEAKLGRKGQKAPESQIWEAKLEGDEVKVSHINIPVKNPGKCPVKFTVKYKTGRTKQ
jgi:hypothetical protein